jgi:hypothetical protein
LEVILGKMDERGKQGEAQQKKEKNLPEDEKSPSVLRIIPVEYDRPPLCLGLEHQMLLCSTCEWAVGEIISYFSEKKLYLLMSKSVNNQHDNFSVFASFALSKQREKCLLGPASPMHQECARAGYASFQRQLMVLVTH